MTKTYSDEMKIQRLEQDEIYRQNQKRWEQSSIFYKIWRIGIVAFWLLLLPAIILANLLV